MYLCSLKLLMAISGDTLHLHNKNINLVQKGGLLTLLPATRRDPDKAGKFNLSPFPFVSPAPGCDPRGRKQFPPTAPP